MTHFEFFAILASVWFAGESCAFNTITGLVYAALAILYWNS